MSFGRAIANARKRAKLSLKELAARILKEDGQPISPQYLNDIEHNHRNPPPDYLIRQLAQELDIEVDLLNFYAGVIPQELRNIPANEQNIIEAYAALRQKLQQSG